MYLVSCFSNNLYVWFDTNCGSLNPQFFPIKVIIGSDHICLQIYMKPQKEMKNYTRFQLVWELDAPYFRLQFRYGTHWASTHPSDIDRVLTEILLGKNEVLIAIAASAGHVIDSIQFTTNTRLFPRMGTTTNFNIFISSTELLYFNGSQRDFIGLRVSGLAAVSLTCPVN